MKVGWILLIIFQLVFKAISRIIKGMDLINPERFLVKGVESQGKADEKAKNDDKNFFSSYVTHGRESQLLFLSIQSLVFST